MPAWLPPACHVAPPSLPMQAVETCLQAVRAGHASPAPYLPPTGQELEKVLKEENRAASAALHAARDAAFKAGTLLLSVG